MRYVTRYRVYPTRKTQDEIFHQFGVCTELRNYCLDNKSYNVRVIAKLKKEHPEFNLKDVHSIVLQNQVFQIQYNLKALKSSKAKGRKVGKMRHKLVRSLDFEQSGFSIVGDTLNLSKIGDMKIVISRPIPGVIGHVILKFTRSHKWRVSVISNTPDEAGEQIEKEVNPEDLRTVGIDMNLINFSTDTDGKVFKHPHNVRKSAKRLATAQRKAAKKRKGSQNRRKSYNKVARIYEQVENRRDDFLHKWSRYYVQNYDQIAVEKLNITDMIDQRKSHGNATPLKMKRGMNRNTYDAAWGKAREFLTYKAESAGRLFKPVDPSYTSQDCSRCGMRVPKDLSERMHVCPSCGYTVDRDLNAAFNIRKKAFYVGLVAPEFTLTEIGIPVLAKTPEQIPIDEVRIPLL